MKKFNSIYTAVKGAGLVGLLAAGSSAAMAADFDATATVQNALEVTVVNGMNLGTIFATTASSNLVGIIRLNPDGTVEDAVASADADADAPNIISLGGQDPARGSITVGSREAFTLTLPVSVSTANLADDEIAGGTDEATATVANMTELRLGGAGGDPTVARLYLANMTVGEVTGGSISGDTTSAATDCESATRLPAAAGGAITCEITPSFGSTLVEFAIGADIVTDPLATATNRNTYQEGTYTGTFEVTATY